MEDHAEAPAYWLEEVEDLEVEEEDLPEFEELPSCPICASTTACCLLFHV